MFSDIHYSKKFNITLQNNIITNIKKLKTNYICITSDLTDNEKYSDENVNIIGINLPPSYYHNYPIENIDIVINEINKQNYTLDNKYNILLIHSPRRILIKKAIDNIDILKNIDLILSGHMHDGVVPKFLKKFPTSIGFIRPHKKFSRNMLED